MERPRRLLRPFALFLLFALALALPSAPARAVPEPGGGAGSAEVTPIPAREIRDWRVLLQRGDAYLSLNAALVESTAAEIPRRVEEIRDRMLGLEVRFFRLLALYGARRKTPILLYDMEEQIRSLERRMQALAGPLERAEKNLTGVEEFVPAGTATEKTTGFGCAIDVPAPAEIEPLLSDFKRRNAVICARAAALKGEIAGPLARAGRFTARLQEFRKTVAGETGKVLRAYYREPVGKLLGAEGVRQACAYTVMWFRNFAAVDLTFNQYDDRVWRMVIVRALLSAALLLAAARPLLKRMEARAGVAGLARALAVPAVWISAGLALFIGASFPLFTRSAFIAMLIWILVGRGLISLGEVLQSLAAHDSPPRVSWRNHTLWCAVAAGNILQSLDYRIEALALLWSALLALLWLFLLPAKGGTVPGRRALLWFLPALFLCSIGGRVNLAIFAATIVLVIRIGAVLSAGIAACRRRFPQGDSEGRPGPIRFVRDIVSPTNVFIATLIAGLVGYVVYLGGGPVLRILFGMKIEIRHVTLHVASIPLIVAAYFATRTVVSIVGDIIPMMRSARAESSEGEIVSLQVLSRYVIWFVFAMLSLAALGFTVGNLALVAGGLSVGIGFGMQNIINNFVSGIILLLGRDIQPGDMIERDGNFARVEQVTLRNTILRTYAGKTIIAPNSEFITKSFSNWTYRDPRIRGSITVKVPASCDSRGVEELLLQVARANKLILKFPVPSVRLEGFAQGNLEFSLRAWVAHPRDWKVISDLRHDVIQALKSRGIAVA